MGGNIDTGTQTSGLSNEAMKSAATTIGNQLNTQLNTGVKPYTQSMVPGLSSQTQAGVGALTNNPNNAAYGSSIGNTMNDFGAIASGQRFGMNDPGYAAMRENLIDDVTSSTNAAFNASGRFGGGSNVESLSRGLTSGLSAMDYANFQNDQQRQTQAAQMLPGLYSASNMPAAASLQAGQLMDQWNTAKAQDDARIFDATQNAGWNTLQRGGAIFGGTAPVSGTTTTESQPWWKVGTGLGASFLGMA